MTSAPAAHRPATPKPSAPLDTHSVKMPATSRTHEQAQNRTEVNSAAAFLDALRMTLKWEGGYGNDPDDPGKATMLGIIQVEYNRYRREHNLPQQHVSAISKQEMMAIYRQKYWDATGCNQLAPKIATVNFDTAVNCGTNGAKSVMQRALKLSGLSMQQLGSLSVEQEAAFLSAHTQARMERYHGICERWEARGKPRAWKFMNGWANRTCDLAKYVGVNAAELSKVFDRATLASTSGAARDWTMPNNWSAGSGNLLMTLGGRFSAFGGSIVGFFSNLLIVPKIDLQIDQLEKPPMETRCLEQREDSPEAPKTSKLKQVKKRSVEEERKTALIEESKLSDVTEVRAAQQRLKREQQELLAALERRQKAHR